MLQPPIQAERNQFFQNFDKQEVREIGRNFPRDTSGIKKIKE